MNNKLRVAVFLQLAALLGTLQAAKLPDFITKCTKESPDFSKCLVDNANNAIQALKEQKGYSKWKLNDINEVHADQIQLENGKDLKLTLENATIVGAQDNIINEIILSNDELSMKVTMPRYSVVGHYVVSGHILIMPIQGSGIENITFVGQEILYKAKLFIEERGGKKYYSVKNDDSTSLETLDLKRIYMQFEDLFNGDKRLGDELNKFLNENWREVLDEVLPTSNAATCYLVYNQYINGFFSRIPIDELFN